MGVHELSFNVDSNPMAEGHPRIAVVIPFFQRTPGLLGRAIRSVFVQGDLRPLVLVVDDGSPISAEDEVRSLPEELRIGVLIDRQGNAGPGAARNRGLDLLPEDIVYIAFLDSDDQWLPGHLARAVAALESGRDFYFSNYLDIGSGEGGFEMKRLIDCAAHDSIMGLPSTYAFRGDLCDAILSGCPVETSTVVFRRQPMRDLRFRGKFRHAYEDLMFWFEAAARSSRVAFSSQIGCQYGEGVNMFRGIQAGSDAALRALVASTFFRSGVRAAFPLSVEQRARVLTRLRANREALAYELLHRLRRRRSVPWGELLEFVRADPASSALLPWEIARHLARWVCRGVA